MRRIIDLWVSDPSKLRLRVFYVCPQCGHEWDDEWDCACEDDCPECGLRHITPVDSEEIIEDEG